MPFLTIALISLALAVDAFAVALAAGVSLCNVDFRQTFRLAWHFGFFQGAMTIIGWAAGLSVRAFIESFAPWIAFGLLALIGVKMIIEALRDGPEERAAKDPTRGKTLLILSVATSIDALAIGLSFAVLKVGVWFPALFIGITATALTAFGLHLGCLLSNAAKLGAKAEIFGGLVLVAIGLKILSDHGVF